MSSKRDYYWLYQGKSVPLRYQNQKKLEEYDRQVSSSFNSVPHLCDEVILTSAEAEGNHRCPK